MAYIKSALLLVTGVRSSYDSVEFMQTSSQSHSQSQTTFDEYVNKYARTYERGSEEYSERAALFQQRLDKIHEQNSKPNRLWTAGLNHLTDRTEDEFSSLRGWRGNGRHHVEAHRMSLLAQNSEVASARSLPETVDWSNLSSARVNKDQGGCGSCWALATAGMLETRYEVAHGKRRSFAPQELVDCVPNPKSCGGDGGCKGATIELAMKYVTEHGLSDETTTPYLGRDQACRASLAAGASSTHMVEGLMSWSTLPENKAQPLMAALMDGPVGVSVAAEEWMMYDQGIFDSCEKDSVIDHAVLMTGFGKGDRAKYWNIKNSWGDSWGEKGYIKLLRHDSVDQDDKHCGTDRRPGDGVACKPYPAKVTVCGMCGILYDSVATAWAKKK